MMKFDSPSLRLEYSQRAGDSSGKTTTNGIKNTDYKCKKNNDNVEKHDDKCIKNIWKMHKYFDLNRIWKKNCDTMRSASLSFPVSRFSHANSIPKMMRSKINNKCRAVFTPQIYSAILSKNVCFVRAHVAISFALMVSFVSICFAFAGVVAVFN